MKIINTHALDSYTLARRADLLDNSNRLVDTDNDVVMELQLSRKLTGYNNNVI